MSTDWGLTALSLAADVSLRVVVLAALVGLFLHLCRIQSSSLRHLAWTMVLGAMVLMPMLPRVLPELPVRLPALRDAAQVLAVRPPSETSVTRDVRVTLPPATDSLPSRARIQVRTPPGPPITVIVEQPTQIAWAPMLLSIYACGAAFFFLRFAIGLSGMRNIRRSATAIDAGCPAAASVRESDRVATPVILGVVSPVIVLPANWRSWPAATLDGVIAHERAHLARRDPLVSAIARLNCCIFWFHPLAWWLARAIESAAEDACDAEGVRAMGASRAYADVLVQMARAVRRHQGRLAWRGVGVGGSGSLGRRIDRVLSGAATNRRTRRQSAAVAGSCVLLIGAVAACQRAAAVEPLREDPEITARWAAQKARRDAYAHARSLPAERVSALEAAWAKNPEDLDTLARLLRFYGPDVSGKRAPNESEIVGKRRRMILWLIEHHPEHELLGQLEGQIFKTPLDWLHDPAGYEQAKQIWLAHVARPDVTAAVLDHAAWFFSVEDKPAAERILLQAIALDPDQKTLPPLSPGIGRSAFKSRLGALYAQAIVGSNSFTLFNVIRSTSADRQKDAFAQHARRTLENTTDVALLTPAGQYLVINASQTKSGFDHQSLGRGYIDRAVQLDPSYGPAERVRAWLVQGDEHNRGYDLLRDVPRQQQYAVVAALPEAERFGYLAEFAKHAYSRASTAEHDTNEKDPAAAEEWRALAKRWATDAIALAPKLSAHPAYARTLYEANLVLGILAFREGNRSEAVRYMLEASRGPALGKFDGQLSDQLPNYLLKYGERATVIEFYERAAGIVPAQRDQFLKAAQAIRDGRMPAGYQYLMVPH